MGGRELAVLPEVEAQAQPEPSMDGRGMVRCAWEATYTIDVEADWVSGLYVVRLETVYDDVSQPSEDSYITFVVRDDTRTGHVLMQTAVNTYAAYDLWGGKSCMRMPRPAASTPGALPSHSIAPRFGAGSGQLMQWGTRQPAGSSAVATTSATRRTTISTGVRTASSPPA